MNRLVTLLLTGSSVLALNAADYVTAGDGTTYTLTSLGKIADSGVSQAGNTFTLSNNVVIAHGDKFEMEDGVTVKLADAVQLKIEGTANLDVDESVTITRASETATPLGVYYFNDENKEPITVRNINFEYAGLSYWVATDVTIDHCSFKYANGAQKASGALTLGKSAAMFTITNCEFTDNDVPAIGGGATNSCGVLIDNCTFTDNNKASTRLNPQVNITVGGDLDIVVKNSVIKGNKSPYVGGIVISQMMPIEGTNNILVENLEVRDNAYGISFYGGMNATLKNCRIIENKYPTTAMAGGAGISIYNYTGEPNIIATGNRVEGNVWGVTVLGGKNLNFGKIDDTSVADYNPGENEFVNNGNGGTLYEIYNNTGSASPYKGNPITVYAQGNTWNGEKADAEKIENMIYHKFDNDGLGEVIYMPVKDGGVELTDTGVVAYFDGAAKQVIVSAGSLVEVYTISGNLVGKYTSSGRTDLSALANGLYIVRVNDGVKTETLKCVL